MIHQRLQQHGIAQCRTVALTVLLLTISLSVGCERAPEKRSANTGQQRLPNVVFIMADDLGYGELGSYGQLKIKTPNIDRLAAQGKRFTNNYSGAPVCAPSRAVLMTGKHLGHVSIRGNLDAVDSQGARVEGQHPLEARERTLAELFKEHGYRTGAMGKWGLGPVGSAGDPNAQGFDHFFGYNCQRVAHSYYPPHLWSDHEKVVINEEPIPGHQQQPDGEVRLEDWQATNYAPDLILAEALDFIEQSVTQGEESPFFLYLPFVEPHVAMQPPKEWVDQYPEEWDQRPYRGQGAYLPHPRPRAGYAAMISDLDQHVGAVLDKLAELDLEGDTLVVFTSDNGTTHGHRSDPVLGIGGVDSAFFNSTAGLRGFKGSVYEGGIKVPLIVRWPGRVESGSQTEQVTYFPDWWSTFAELLGESPPTDLDGISLMSHLVGEEAVVERNPLVWVFPEYGGQVAVRFGNYKLVHQGLNADPSEWQGWELYDLAIDPNEQDNIAGISPDVVRQGVAILVAETAPNSLFPVELPRS